MVRNINYSYESKNHGNSEQYEVAKLMVLSDEERGNSINSNQNGKGYEQEEIEIIGEYQVIMFYESQNCICCMVCFWQYVEWDDRA